MNRLTSHIAALSKKKLFTAVVLFLLIVVSHIGGLFTKDFDDPSFYRASSYISRFGDAPLLLQLRQNLEQAANELGFYRYERFRLRLDFPTNFFIMNWLVALLEELPL